jgi:hypothetical protein
MPDAVPFQTARLHRDNPSAGYVRRTAPIAQAVAIRGTAMLALITTVGCAGSARPATEPAVATTPVRALPADTPAAGEAAAPGAAALSAEFRTQFANADTRARIIAYWYQCVGTVARARADGTFGPAAQAPRLIYCTRNSDGVPIGGVYDIDAAFRTVRRLSTIRLDGTRPRYTGAIDTARVAIEAQLVSAVTRVVTPAMSKLGRPFSVVPVPLANGAMEAWTIPRATKARHLITGGDIAYARLPNGTIQRTVDHTASWTQVPLPATGAFTVKSAERDIAAVTDLVTARYHTELGRTVTVHTTTMASTLVPGLDPATGARVVWQHIPTPPTR